jgi:predicted DCC family thiol-disulfide oxidoreductase YuxK
MARGPVLLYDGECKLCNRIADGVVRRDPDDRVHLATLQSETGRGLLRRHGLDPDAVDSVVMREGGRPRLKSEAALRLAAHLGFPWSLLRALRVLPRAWRDALYDFVARRRRRWFGTCACREPAPERRPAAGEGDGA